MYNFKAHARFLHGIGMHIRIESRTDPDAENKAGLSVFIDQITLDAAKNRQLVVIVTLDDKKTNLPDTKYPYLSKEQTSTT